MHNPNRAYLDWAATAPLCDAARRAIASVLEEGCGNPSSVHAEGKRARMRLEEARRRVADVLGASPAEVIFTSGATEADNLALLGAARGMRAATGRNRVLVSAIEHAAVLRAAEVLAAEGFEVVRLPVGADGVVLPFVVDDRVAVVALMAVNNEVGTVQPVRSVSDAAHAAGALVLCDAAQAPAPHSLEALGADLLVVSSHKSGGPLGAGVLVCRAAVPLVPLVVGGEQENRRRGGTENLPAIVGMAAALETDGGDLAAIEAMLVEGMRARVPDARLLGQGHRSARIACFELPGTDAETLLFALDLAGVAASSGSACASRTLAPSHVLLAMGLSEEAARSTLRFSWGATTTEAEVRHVLEVLPGLVERNRQTVAARKRKLETVTGRG